MKRANLWLGLAILVCLVVLGWQRSLRAALQTRNKSLIASQAEADLLLAENKELASPATAALSAGDQASAELPLLRNQVRQLREQQQQIDRLRAENERLRTDADAGRSSSLFSEKEGYLGRDAWTSVGYATPEGVVQTFFAAFRQEAYPEMVACFTEREQRKLRRQFADANGNLNGAQVIAAFKPLAAVPGFRVAGVDTTGGSTRVALQSVRGGAIFEVVVQREGDEWKIQSFGP